MMGPWSLSSVLALELYNGDFCRLQENKAVKKQL